MPCFHPLDAWQTFEGDIHFHARGSSGKSKGAKAPNYRRELKLPCGRCIGCRLDRSKQWSIRLMHEAQLHERNSFITLTYDDWKPRPASDFEDSALAGRAPDSGAATPERPSVPTYRSQESLEYRHYQKFMKRLRKWAASEEGSAKGGIRFYMCGEYGEKLGRPHYHAALFGEDFSGDRYEWRRQGDNVLYRSPRLEKLWPYGHAEIGALTIESAAYIARYIMKKITGTMADSHYQRTDPNTGTNYWLTPEFSVMSRKPGIGKGWIEKYMTDVYPEDQVILAGGVKIKPPRFYDKLFKELDAAAFEEIQEARAAGFNHADNTPARLAVREDCAKAKLAFKKRNLETK